MHEMVDAYEKALSVPQQRLPVCEEVYGRGYDTAGNYHWYGTYTGASEIKCNLKSFEESCDFKR